MILLTVEGTYKDGKVELAETPKGVESARVLVTFLHSGQSPNTELSISGEDDRQKLRERVLARMTQGFHLGGSLYPRRGLSSMARAAISYQIDKKVIDISQQHTAISGTAIDVLENVPSISVDIEGNVSLPALVKHLPGQK